MLRQAAWRGATPFAFLCALRILWCAASAHAEAVESAPPDAPVVNINTASEQELQRLPFIGPARARAIVELRTRLKRFARLEQLLRVKGIGRATFRRLRPLLTLTGPTTLGAKRRRSSRCAQGVEQRGDGRTLELEGDAVRDDHR